MATTARPCLTSMQAKVPDGQASEGPLASKSLDGSPLMMFGAQPMFLRSFDKAVSSVVRPLLGTLILRQTIHMVLLDVHCGACFDACFDDTSWVGQHLELQNFRSRSCRYASFPLRTHMSCTPLAPDNSLDTGEPVQPGDM